MICPMRRCYRHYRLRQNWMLDVRRREMLPPTTSRMDCRSGLQGYWSLERPTTIPELVTAASMADCLHPCRDSVFSILYADFGTKFSPVEMRNKSGKL